MNDQWPVLLAAALGLASTFGVAVLGLLNNRRQVADQAAVEHNQWLRGQRQEAYTAVFPAWDTAVGELRSFQYGWQELLEQQEQMGEGYEPWFLVEQKADGVWGALAPYVERCELLGPKGVNVAAEGMHKAFRDLRTVMEEQSRQRPPSVVWQTWEEQLGKAAVARLNLHLACQRALRRTPSPDVEESHR